VSNEWFWFLCFCGCLVSDLGYRERMMCTLETPIVNYVFPDPD
jgi:hypothetical protein